MSGALLLVPVWLCWGSFLNVVAYRVLRKQSILKPRSRCPRCKHNLAWYDLVPVISWITLGGKCRYCHQQISLLYPSTEVFTAFVMSILIILVPSLYVPAYFILFSALIVSIRSDLETMLISRYMTLFLVPLGIAFSYFGLLPINLWQSIAGSLFGYLLLWSIARLFLRITGKKGMGEGDFELLSLIGSFLGLSGTWYSLMLGAIAGSLIGLFMVHSHHATRNTKIPFAPFLALAAIIITFYQFISFQ